ncbi:uncharacterized protein LOC134310708 [Trichomycterus rosablanca]|uniref:uncharacterized protein LOC134310708 n=1 Tax=Trichomycterus rosablanca TaxID=2290929 RepID=UPI002F355BFE
MPTSLIIGAAVGGLLLLMGLGVVIYWRYRGRRDGQTGSREKQPGQQEAQDYNVMFLHIGYIHDRNGSYSLHKVISTTVMDKFSIFNSPHLHVFGLWEETGAPRGNSRRHGENMQTPRTRTAPPGVRTQDLLAVRRQCYPLSHREMQMFVLLFLSALHLTEGCSELKHQRKVTGFVGQSVVLPCSYTESQPTTEELTWFFVNKNCTQIYANNKTERYTGRVQRVHPGDSRNFSLLISNLTEEDGGVYRCKIGNISKYFQLNVTVCSKLKRQKKVMGFVGQSIVLPCSYTEPQQRAKNITWLLRNHNCHHTKIYPEDRTKRYTGRVQLLHPGDSGNFSLRISNLTEEDGGEYRCKIGNISRNIQLNVTDTEMPTSLIIGAAVGGLLLLMGLGVVIYWRYRGRRDGRTGSREEQPGQRGQQEAQDDVLYSTVVHNNTTRTTTTNAWIELGETEYATVNLN